MKRGTVKVSQPPPPPPEPEPELEAAPPPAETPVDPELPPDDGELEPGPGEKPAKETDKDKGEKLSPIMKNIRDKEEGGLRDWLMALGPGGVYRIALNRMEPKRVRDVVTGQEVTTEGHLRTYDEFIDEDEIKREWGGGKYHLKVLQQTAAGSFRIKNHRILTIAGEPRLDNLTRGAAAPPTTVPMVGPREEPSVVKAALDMMSDQLKRSEERKPDRGIDPAIQMMLDQNKTMLESLQRQNLALQSEIASMRNQKPPEDPLRDKMLTSLMDGDSARLTAVRTQHESELRQLRDNFAQDLKRIEDRHDRTVDAMRRSHDDALAAVKQSYEREIAAMRTSHEMALVSQRTTAEVQVGTLKAQLDRLQHDNDELRRDVKELREKKEKSLVDSIEEVEKIKGLLGTDESEKSGLDKVLEAVTSPGAIDGFGKIASRFQGAAAAAAGGMPDGMVPNPAPGQRRQPPQVVEDATGQRFVQSGNRLIPVKRKPKVVTTEAGTEIEVPAIDQDTIKMMLSLLENAYGNKVDPETVAQSARPRIPPEVMGWLQEHGIDLFMSKVAKLPGTSPLVSQAGKNWLRKVGEVLTGG